jgi:hypothetical protein
MYPLNIYAQRYNPYLQQLNYRPTTLSSSIRNDSLSQSSVDQSVGDTSFGVIFEGETSYLWNRKTTPEFNISLKISRDQIFKYLYNRINSFYIVDENNTKNSFYTNSNLIIAFYTPEEFNEKFYDGYTINITLYSKDFMRIPASVYTLYDKFNGQDKTFGQFDLSVKSNVTISIV